MISGCVSVKFRFEVLFRSNFRVCLVWILICFIDLSISEAGHLGLKNRFFLNLGVISAKFVR